MTAIPAAGPSASTGKAQRQPNDWTIPGTSWIVTMVSRKPSEVWSVSAVPTAWGGAASVTIALNCAESATTKNPHTATSAATSAGGAPKSAPTPSEHAALAAIAQVTTRA